MYLIDTPGVLSPRIGSVETGLKLALCGKMDVGAMAASGWMLFFVVSGSLCSVQYQGHDAWHGCRA